ncbi:MAG: PHP domain-containing protein [Lachnospiraceae bacterium]|nr:PHP domain-containing protein [Lachnospiraceae bacterium]
MRICDTHVHSFRSFVGADDMTLKNMESRAKRIGVDTIAITDHLMSERDVDELLTTRDDILSFRSGKPGVNVLFGVEVCEVNHEGMTLLDEELIRHLNLELVIGGVHETHVQQGASLEEVAVMQHRHHMMMMENPLISILVHPWWLDREEFTRLSLTWPENMSFIPEELTVELAHASRRTHTFIEISTMSGLCNRDASAQFRNDLQRYYQLLMNEGAYFAVGTDSHQISEMESIASALEMVKKLQIPEDRFWQPSF